MPRWRAARAACCSLPHPRGAIIRKPPAVNTLKDAADVIGKGGISKAEEIVALAGVDLEPQLLKEWMANAGALLSAVNANKTVAAFAALAASEPARGASNHR